MERASVRELKAHASEILRRVREESESYEITHRGKPIARLVPTVDEGRKIVDLEGLWASRLTREQIEQLDKGVGEVQREVQEQLDRLAAPPPPPPRPAAAR